LRRCDLSLLSSVAVYFVIWWVVLFAVLPFGVQSQAAEDVVPGTDPGAPSQPRLVRVAVITSLVAAVLFAGVYAFFGILGYTIEDLLI
jgi:predicted secreted protein